MTIASTGGTVTLGLYDTQSQLKEKASITYVDNKVDPLQAGHKGYATLAQAQASQSGLAANTVVEVLSDTTEANNGYYLWNGTTLTKTTFSPLVQANNYTDSKVATAKAEAIATAASDATTKSNAAISTASSDATTKANNAVTIANNYTDSRYDSLVVETEQFANQAEAAATAANIAGKVYATAAEGLAPITGVPSGQYFNVRSSSNDNYIDEYLNNAGTAQATGKSYPSSSYVQDIENYVAKPFVNGKTYALSSRVQLSNGDIVRSTVAANTVNPNVDMTGWVKVNAASQIFDESGLSQQIYNRMIKNSILTKKNLRDLGFKGDGSDESTLLQTVFDSISGIDLDFGGLTISVSKQVNLINKERFKLRNGAVKATANFKSDAHVQPVVNITRSSHWSIYDFDFDGNRFNRTQPTAPAEPVWHTLQIYGGCKNFYMQNVNLKDGMMENLYICGGTQPNWDDIPTGGVFINVHCDKGFRNSSAIIHGIDLVFINSSFTGAYGNAAGPCSGLDIESNNDGGALSNLQFIGCKFEGNSMSQVQVSGKDYIRSIKFYGGTIKGGAYPESSPIVWYSSAAIFDGVTISGFTKTAGDQVIRIPSSGDAGKYPDRFVMRNCVIEDISAATMPLFYVHSHSCGLSFESNTVRNITCLEIGHIYGGNNSISGNTFESITGKNWQYDTVVSGNEPVVNISDNVFKGVTGSLRIAGKLYKNTFVDCGTDAAETYVARIVDTSSTAIENKFIATTVQTKNALVTVNIVCSSYNNATNYSNPYSITNSDAVTQRTVAIGNTKDGVTVNFDFLVNLGTQDLNTLYQRNATFLQASGANGTTARNYPTNGFYGTIQVIDITTTGDYVYCTQIATFAGEKLQWIRRGTRFGAGSVNWQAWDIIPNSSLATRGATASRPTTHLFNGRIYFDTTLAAGGKPIWYTSGQWVDATGTVV